MRVPKTARTTSLVLSLALLGGGAGSTESSRDLGRETLGANDGWAASAPGTTGGAAAVPAQVYVVTNRQELVAALNNGVYPPPSTTPSNEPKIIYVDGTIDANVDDDNQPLTCEDYNAPGFTLEAFLVQFDPAGPWGRTNPSGPLEVLRVASQMNQQARVRIRVGSNTTIVGLTRKARIRGAWLDIRGQPNVAGSRTNIIIRNINFEDTYDCFPAWAPNDGAQGNWNALYDSVSLRDSDHVWIDHNRFRDKETKDETLPIYYGRIFQVHDGHLDITNASDLVTVSWNEFLDHDKMMLIGSSDTAAADRGKLRVTLHHNRFDSLGQRAPRVRFGKVHVYNNFYRIDNPATYGYSWGVGVESAIYAENNAFKTDEAVTPDLIIERFNGTAIHATGTLVNGKKPKHLVDVRAAWNAVNDPDLLGDVGWTPTLFGPVMRTADVRAAVKHGAGPFNWRAGDCDDDDDHDDDDEDHDDDGGGH